MRVTGTPPQPQVQRAGDARSKATESRRSAPSPESSKAPVRLSSAGKALATARAPESPDTARIERLKAMLEKGTLPVDPGAIADAMMREER